MDETLRRIRIDDKTIVLTDQPPGAHDRQIAASMDLPPDTVIEVRHGRCGQPDCTRAPGTVVRVAVTWLHGGPGELEYKAEVACGGHRTCAQVVTRGARMINALVHARTRR